MATHFENFEVEGNIFIKKVAQELGDPDDREHAFRVTQSVFYVLRDRITIEESMHLISQLPMAIKALYVNNWKISKDRRKDDTSEEFYNAIREQSRRLAARDFGNDSQTRHAVHAVFSVIKQYAGEGEIKDIQSQLPQPLAELWEA